MLEILKPAKTAGELRLLGLTQWKGCGDAAEGARNLAAAFRAKQDIRLAMEYDECLAENRR